MRPRRQRAARNVEVDSPVAVPVVATALDELTLTLVDAPAGAAEVQVLVGDGAPSPAGPGASPVADPAGALAAAVAAIVAPFGLPEQDQRDAVVAAVDGFLSSSNIEADIVSLRYGVLTLATDAALVQFVRCDAERIAEVCSGAGYPLRDVRVRTRRR
jgi:hypothetical protein